MTQHPRRGSPVEPRFLIIGFIRKPHGTDGEMRVTAETELPERFANVKRVFVSRDPDDADPQPVTVESVRFSGDDVLLRLTQYSSREQAATLRGHYVLIPLAEAIELEEDEYFLYELIGLQVETVDGEQLGTLVDVLQTGANNVFVIDGEQGELLLPDIDEVVQQIDFSNRLMQVNLLPGLR